ncbi:MAG: hypothetical protein WC932_02195 [archaeon]|jgi:hypothetical protein
MRHYGSKSVPIDPEIKSLVLELNKKGYKTEQSCAGHGYRGYISFLSKNRTPPYRYLTKEEATRAISIARKHGCERVEFPPSLNAGGKVFATMSFSSMGKK